MVRVSRLKISGNIVKIVFTRLGAKVRLSVLWGFNQEPTYFAHKVSVHSATLSEIFLYEVLVSPFMGKAKLLPALMAPEYWKVLE